MLTPPRRVGQEGSVLALVPAAFLVLVALGALATDSGAAYLGQRQLSDAVAAAANDAAAAALSSAAFYGSGQLVVDPTAAASVVCQTVAAQADTSLHHIRLAMAVAGPAIVVRATASVDAVFGRALPNVGSWKVAASAEAVAARGGGAAPAVPGPLAALSC